MGWISQLNKWCWTELALENGYSESGGVDGDAYSHLTKPFAEPLLAVGEQVLDHWGDSSRCRVLVMGSLILHPYSQAVTDLDKCEGLIVLIVLIGLSFISGLD